MLIHFSRDYGFFSISSLLDENLIFLKKLSMLLKACTLTKKKILSNSIYLMQKLNLEYQILKHGKKDYQCLDAFINLFWMIISIINICMTLLLVLFLRNLTESRQYFSFLALKRRPFGRKFWLSNVFGKSRKFNSIKVF